MEDIEGNQEVSTAAKICIEQTKDVIEYDVVHDTVVTKNEEEFNRVMEEHCKVKQDKGNKLKLLKNQVLEKVRMFERHRLGLKPSRSRSFRRGRSEDSDSDAGSQKSLKMTSTQPVNFKH